MIFHADLLSIDCGVWNNFMISFFWFAVEYAVNIVLDLFMLLV